MTPGMRRLRIVSQWHPARRPRRRAQMRLALMCTLGLGLAASGGCQSLTEMILLVDTDLTAPVDLDRVDIAITGPTNAVPETFTVKLEAGSPGQFPLSLGLTTQGALSPVDVTVTALEQGQPVAKQEVRTSFVSGERRLLRMLMLSSCLGTSCADGQTCGGNGCGPIDRPGIALPTWTGEAPAPPDSQPTLPIRGRTIWVSAYHSCANEGRVLYCWGRNFDGQLGSGTTQNANGRKPVMNVSDPLAVGLGQIASCVCDQSGGALCFGSNLRGELGNGTLVPSLMPTPVSGITDCAQMSGGAVHMCLLHVDGTVSCWGDNAFGQVGAPPATTPVTLPVTIPGLTGVVEVGAGERHTCARRGDGTVLCWGDNAGRQLGDGTTISRSSPTLVTGLSDVVELAVGRFSTCARQSTLRVRCWGANAFGQLGNGTTVDSARPVEVAGLADAMQISVGQQHTCALHATGILSCWGRNQYGQLGNGTTIDSQSAVDVLDISGVTSMGAGSRHSCARHSSGVSCWGDNMVFQLGDGTGINRLEPVLVGGFP